MSVWPSPLTGWLVDRYGRTPKAAASGLTLLVAGITAAGRLPRLGWNLGLVSGTRDDFYGVQSSATTRRSVPGAMRSMAGMTFV